MAEGTHRRPGTGFPARLLSLAAALAAWAALGAVAPAAAQDTGDPEPGEGTLGDQIAMGGEADTLAAVEAGPDSAATAKMLESLSPSYATNYNVARQVTTWVQTFDFGARFKLLDFTNKTRYDVRTDDGRDETRRSGGNVLDLRWLMIPRLPVTTSFNLQRESIKRPEDERQSTDIGLNLSTVYTLRMGKLRHTLTGGTGYKRRTDLSVRNDLRSESKDSGVTGTLSWKGHWAPWTPLTLDASAQEDRSHKTSRLQNEGGAVETRPTRTRSRRLRLSAVYNPAPWLNGNASVSDNSGNDEFFIVQGGKGDLESKVNSSRTVSASFQVKPVAGTSLGVNLGANDSNLAYRVRTDIASKGNGTNWSGSVDTEVLGTTVNSKLNRTRDVRDPATSAKITTETSVWDGMLKRALSPKIGMQFNWLLRTSQLFFTDSNPDNVLDRDERRTKFQPMLTYTPGNKWSVTASYARSTSRQVQLNARRANQTQDEEDYTVDMTINYALSEAATLSQSYSIKALYTTFDYAAGSNRLLSTQRIVSTVQTAITPKVNLSLEHRFTLQDSGPFSFDPNGGRVFARSLRKYRQELTTDLQYKILPWLTFATNSRFLRTDDVNEYAGRRSVNRNLELKTGGVIDKNLGRGATLRVDAQFLRSNQYRSYWSITSSLTKDF